MPFQIAAKIIFDYGLAVTGMKRFTRESVKARLTLQAYRNEAHKAGVSVKEMTAVMNSAKAMDHSSMQNIRITNQLMRTFAVVTREGRLAWTAFAKATGRGGTSRATSGVRHHVNRTLKMVRSQGGGLREGAAGILSGASEGFSALTMGMAHMAGEGGGGVNIREMFGETIKMASKMEDARVTFDAMLGDTKKSEELWGRITEYAAKTPFTRQDVIQGSRRLLSITRDNVDENERLFKIAGNIAALRPGSEVQDVARGIVSATYGEFEILKGTFGINLNAKMFKGKGEKGSKEYVKAVTEEIDRQFKEKTGGRDIVGMLSGTLTGLMSTLQDNFDMLGDTIGDSFMKAFDLKGLVKDAIGWLEKFSKVFEVAMTGNMIIKSKEDYELLNGTIGNMAYFLRDVIVAIGWFGHKMKDAAAYAYTLFDGLSTGTQKAIMVVGLAFITFGSSGGPLAILLSGLTAAGLALAAIAAPFSEFLIPIGSTVAFVTGAILLPMFIALTVLAAGFALVRKDGESFTDTITRVGMALKDYGYLWFLRLSEMLRGVWIPLHVRLNMAWAMLKESFKALKGPANELMSLMFGHDAITGMRSFFDWGLLIGSFIGKSLTSAVYLLNIGIYALATGLKFMQPQFKQLVSDLYAVGKAIIDIFTGVGSAKANLGIVLRGFVDIVSTPFRELLALMFEMSAKALFELGLKVSQFSETIGNQISFAGSDLYAYADSIREGLLATREGLDAAAETPIKVEMSESGVPIQVNTSVNIDGEKLGDSQAKTKMRARNAGRGGDPVSPDELGFVLEGGGTRIRAVGLNEVFSGGS